MKHSKPNPTQTHFCAINRDYLHAQTVDTYYLPCSDDINCINSLVRVFAVVVVGFLLLFLWLNG